jgi:IS605 OrfB family transposase
MSRDSDEWHLSFCGEVEPLVQVAIHKTPVGIDRGVVKAVVASDGFTANREMVTAGEGKRFVRLQQKLARQAKGSKRRHRTRVQLANLHRTIRRRRQDFAHQTSRQLVNSHDLIVLEDLRVNNMTASARGTIANPGTNVKAKAALNRAILDKGWGRLKTYIAYKLEREGGKLILVNPAFSSQQCSECDHIDAKSRVSQSWFCCTKCGHAENADINAAKVILGRGLKIVYAEGLSVSGQGDLCRGMSMNCQSPLLKVA